MYFNDISSTIYITCSSDVEGQFKPHSTDSAFSNMSFNFRFFVRLLKSMLLYLCAETSLRKL